MKSIARSVLFVFSVSLVSAALAEEEGYVTAGWVEKAVVYPDGVELHAKLDTGAKTSSINAPDPVFYEQDGRRWVRIELVNRNQEKILLNAPLVREATIKRHYGESQVRPVIKLDICIGRVRKTEEVNLVDRQGLNYQLLIGRNFLKGALLIDSGSTYRLSPDCPG